MATIDESAYDIFILKYSGIPLFAGCTGSDYCKAHFDQHELQAGFLAALFAFSQEAFDNETIKRIDFSQIQLNIASDKERELLFIAIHTIDQDSDIVHDQLIEAVIRFNRKYPDKIPDYLKVGQYDDFREELKEIGLIKNTIRSIIEMQNESKTKKLRLRTWIKSIWEKY